MIIDTNSQDYEAYLPVYDYVPEKWEDGRIFLVEILKKISNAVNVREIGFLLDEELLTGKSLYPNTANNQTYRSVLRTVINTGGVVAGLNTFAHGVVVDANFTLVDLWAAASNTTTLVGTPINGTGNIAAARTGLDINYDVTNVYVLSDGTYDVCNIFFEYTQG